MHGGDMGVQERLKESGDRKGRIAKMPGKRGAEACRWTSVDPLEPPAVTPHRILRLMLLHIKYLYGIRVEVRGAHHFPPSQPYVVVSNHQSSLDLLGEALLEHTSQPCPPPSSWNSPRIFSRTRSPAPQLGRGCLSLISRVVGLQSPFPPLGRSLALPPVPLFLYIQASVAQ